MKTISQNTTNSWHRSLSRCLLHLDFNVLSITQGHFRTIRLSKKNHGYFRTILMYVKPFLFDSEIHKINPYTNMKQNILQYALLSFSDTSVLCLLSVCMCSLGQRSFLMLHCLSGTVSLAKLDHQMHSHISDYLWNLTSSNYPIDCVCVVFLCSCASLFWLCFGALLCNGLCAPTWRNNTGKSTLLLLLHKRQNKLGMREVKWGVTATVLTKSTNCSIDQ